MSDMLEVVVDSVRASLMSPQRVVVLRQTAVECYLPVWIGPYEAEAITVALQEVELARPLTHDLLKNLFDVFEVKILRAEIVAMKEDVFYGNLVAQKDEKIFDIDSRPSDAIAIALRAHVPILVSQEVMDVAGIVPERDLRAEGDEIGEPEEPIEPSAEPPAPSAAADEGRLDVFEDFLKKLGKDTDDDKNKPKDN